MGDALPAGLYARLTRRFLAAEKAVQRRRRDLVFGLQRLIPSIPHDAVIETRFQTVRDRAQGMPSDGLPAPIAAKLDGWRHATSEESLRVVTEPCVVEPKLGVAFVRGRVVWGSTDFPYRERDLAYHTVPFARRRLDEAILLHDHWAPSYFHFWNDFLVKAAAADEWGVAPGAPFVVPAAIAETPFFAEARALGAFAGRDVVVQGRREALRVGRAWLIRTFDTDRLRFDALADRLRPETAHGDRRLFLARSPRFGRRFANQGEIDAVLARHGVERLVAEDMALSEQIAAFASARWIVAAHGAGLVNMMFRRDPCSVVEIYADNFGTPRFALMAWQRGFEHVALTARSEAGREKRSDSRLDPAALDAALARLG
ncbi:MAG: DUF563 domain-containing protein [Paracoccaceae bacterium]